LPAMIAVVLDDDVPGDDGMGTGGGAGAGADVVFGNGPGGGGVGAAQTGSNGLISHVANDCTVNSVRWLHVAVTIEVCALNDEVQPVRSYRPLLASQNTTTGCVCVRKPWPVIPDHVGT
jgi:hypothetical protein